MKGRRLLYIVREREGDRKTAESSKGETCAEFSHFLAGAFRAPFSCPLYILMWVVAPVVREKSVYIVMYGASCDEVCP